MTPIYTDSPVVFSVPLLASVFVEGFLEALIYGDFKVNPIYPFLTLDT